MATRAHHPAQARRIGRNLQALRRAHGLNQEELAEKINASPRYIQGIEAGSRLPSLTIADALRKALGTTWDGLLG